MTEIFKGDTSEIIYVRPSILSSGDLLTGWECFVGVVDYTNTIEVEAREVITKATVAYKDPETGITSDEECFMCYLTPTETSTLSIDVATTLHSWVIEISNAATTPPFNLEIHNELYVKAEALEA